MPRFTAALAVLLFASACCTPTDPPPPRPFDPCGGRFCEDSGFPVSEGGLPPIIPPELCATSEFGAPCERACTQPGLTCFGERSASTTVDTADGPVVLDAVAFPDGLCSRPCAVDSECGSCARCVPYALAGRAKLRGLVGGSGVCRPSCALGCADGTVCDPELDACVEACTSDVQCRFHTVDTDDDGIEDMLAYEADSELACLEGRCLAAGASVGELCTSDALCAPGFACFRRASGVTGRCGRLGCSIGASGACGAGGACVVLDPERTVCTLACEIGADAPERRLGPTGGGQGCDLGWACAWTGRPFDPGETPEGACIPGNYNDVTEPNVGAPCTASSECWSPYGRGRCLLAAEGAVTGVCVVAECEVGGTGLRPGVPSDPPLCDVAGGQRCFDIWGLTACGQACTAAESCLPGWACVLPPGGRGDVRICSPDCAIDADCRPGTGCLAADATPCARDVDRGCTCG